MPARSEDFTILSILQVIMIPCIWILISMEAVFRCHSDILFGFGMSYGYPYYGYGYPYYGYGYGYPYYGYGYPYYGYGYPYYGYGIPITVMVAAIHGGRRYVLSRSQARILWTTPVN